MLLTTNAVGQMNQVTTQIFRCLWHCICLSIWSESPCLIICRRHYSGILCLVIWRYALLGSNLNNILQQPASKDWDGGLISQSDDLALGAVITGCYCWYLKISLVARYQARMVCALWWLGDMDSIIVVWWQ